jgi:hypothetical protein
MEDKALLSTEVASGAEKAELLIVIPAYNEAEFARQVAERYQTNHFVDTVESDDFDLIGMTQAESGLVSEDVWNEMVDR